MRSGTTKAAGEVLHLAQPSVSRALLSLEARLGQPVFHRTAKGLVPTAAARRLAKASEDILTDLHSLESELRARPCTPPRLRLVSECHTAYHWLPGALRDLREALPEIDLSIELQCTADPIAALDAGEVDAALLTTAMKATEALEVCPLFMDEVVFIVADDHALAAKKSLRPDDLCNYPLFTARATPAEQRWFSAEVFGRSRRTLDISWVPLTEAIVDLSRAGMGIGLLTEWVAGGYLAAGGLVARRLGRKALRRPWQLAWRRDVGEAGPALARALKKSERQRRRSPS